MSKRNVNSKGRGNKPQTKLRRGSTPVSEDNFSPENNCKQKGFNDISWYTRNPGLVESTCRLPFANPVGSQLWLNTDKLTEDKSFLYSPGIFTIRFIPGPGVGTTDTSPINKASQLVYAKMRMANSGSTNYDPVDLMMYIMAVDSAYTMIAYMQRIYGICMQYKAMSRYYPQAILEASYASPDIAEHMPELATLINESIAQIKMFAVPSDFDIITRHAWMTSNIYKDADDDKSQLFMYVPMGYYVYNEANGKLDYRWMKQKQTVNDLRVVMDDIMTPLFLSQSAGIMSGDLQKAFPNKLFSISPMSMDYAIDAVRNDNVLIQMMNATTVPANLWKTPVHFDIVLDRKNNRLNWRPSGAIGSDALTVIPDFDNIILNTYSKDVSANEVMEMTRLTTTFGYTLNDEGVPTEWYVESCGTEIAWSYEIYTFIEDTNGSKVLGQRSYHTYESVPDTTLQLALTQVAYLEMFDWHPPVLYFGTTSQPYIRSNIVSIHLDLDNYTLVSKDSIAQIHNVALYSLFGINA